jgi:Holliday junction resolvase RusA-like endonuclease
MECKFKVIGEIKTKQRPRATTVGGHAKVYTPQTTINYENYVKSEFLRQCPDVHFEDKPLLAIVYAYFSPSQELNKYDAYRVACMNSKDLDNIAKTMLDALNGVAYNDDRQIVQLEVCKNYIQDEPEHVEVVLKELEIFNTLEELKKEKQMDKLKERYKELMAKPKLTSTEMKRLSEIAILLGYDNDDDDEEEE